MQSAVTRSWLSPLTLLALSLFCWLLVPAVEAQNGDFSIVLLPDTQYYSASHPNILNSQMLWIVNNAAARNVQMVLGLGDIVNNGGSSTEWTTADAAYKQLDATHIPYFAAIGNHDYDNDNPRGAHRRDEQFQPVLRRAAISEFELLADAVLAKELSHQQR
jgi:calcineurin-like phosphoesterase family protein